MLDICFADCVPDFHPSLVSFPQPPLHFLGVNILPSHFLGSLCEGLSGVLVCREWFCVDILPCGAKCQPTPN